MRRRGISQYLSMALLALGLFAAVDSLLLAQDRPSGSEPKRERPGANALLKVQQLSPELERILKEWSEASSKIEKLQGKHSRWIYNHTYEMEKQASGVFYYEYPDKGRIDIEGQSKPFRGARKKFLNGKLDNKNGKAYEFKGDLNEIWIADGRFIKKIDGERKMVDMFPIPPDKRGRNIMDGPLPFLFGMPPEKAKQRFWFTLMGENEKNIWLQILPKLQQDRANWKEAKVILNKPEYLPSAVQLIDPAGTTETAYQFYDLEVNKKRKFWNNVLAGGRHWTNPKELDDFQKNIVEPQATKLQKDQQLQVPSLIGLHFKKAEQVLDKLGYKFSHVRGTRTTRKNLVFCVEAQSPAPNTRLPKGGKVTLKLYDKPQSTAQQTDGRTGMK